MQNTVLLVVIADLRLACDGPRTSHRGLVLFARQLRVLAYTLRGTGRGREDP